MENRCVASFLTHPVLYFQPDNGTRYRGCGLREFSEHLFRHVSFLKGYAHELETILADWKEYKIAVPTYGAILIDKEIENILLVQVCGFKLKDRGSTTHFRDLSEP